MSVEEDSPSYDGPETFRSLLEGSIDIDHYLAEPEISPIRSVSAFLARMRQACADNARLDIAELMNLLAALEVIGARGWHEAWQGRAHCETWIRLRQMLEDRRLELMKAEYRIEELEQERNELSRHLSRAVARMESLDNQFSQLQVNQQPLDCAPPPNRPGTLSDVDESDEEFRTHGSRWGTESLPLKQEPKEIRKCRSSSNVTEVGDPLHDQAMSYPPPLALATEEARNVDEMRTSMLSEVENTLWIQESKDREYLVKRLGPPLMLAQPPPSSQRDYPGPFYVYMPLPPKITIPQAQNNPQIPSLMFPTPPAVFHFPECGTRDQLLDVLRSGFAGRVGDEDIGPIDDINIIRVRTHEFEWELKNAIRKTLTDEEWDDLVGDDWVAEGRGDTYIVSKRDVHFQEQDCNSNSMPAYIAETSEASTLESAKKDADHEGRPEYFSNHLNGNGKEPEDTPQMRGGALSPLPSLSSSSSVETSYGSQNPCTLRDNNDNYPFAPMQPIVPVEHPHGLIDQARILQLQNASHGRMISLLENVIKDVEGTVEWQDNELAQAHRHITHLQQKLRERSEETLLAGRMAEFARAETHLLREQLQQIHNQVVNFSAELDDHERHILARYPGLLTRDLSANAELRGGGDPPHDTASSSSAQPTDEAITPIVEAHSFYFFPSVSMVVLLSSPLHHFQFPKHTSLARIRQMLQNFHMEGRDTDLHLRQVRKIFEARDEAGIVLPETSNGRQVLISAPEIQDSASTSSGKPGYKGTWNKTFGPTEYQYERMLKDSIDSLKPLTADDTQSRSPTASIYEEKFHDTGILVDTISPLGSLDEVEFYNAGELIDIIEHEAEISRARSTQKLTDLLPKTRSRGDSLGERRGYAMSLPLPSNTLGPMFPTGYGTAPAPNAMGEHLTPQPVGVTGVKAWRFDPYPPHKSHDPAADELSRGHLFDYEKGPPTISNIGLRHNPLSLERPLPRPPSSPSTNLGQHCEESGKPTTRSRRSTEDGWGMWRHRADEGCEGWIDPSKLDPSRETCAFCNLPFTEKAWRTWEYNETPTYTSHPPHEGPRDPDPGLPNPCLRGGAEDVEWAHLQCGAYDAVSSSWADEMSLERPVSPRKKSLVMNDDGEVGIDDVWMMSSEL
ncbi:hypothetical protein DPSP01_007322 [Paraphaeosphaeria sporulosa]